MSTSGAKKIKLKSIDGEVFEVEEAVAVQSQVIKHIVEDICVDGEIPVPNVTGRILALVIEYCKKHVESAAAGDEDPEALENSLRAWDADFIMVEQSTLFDLIRREENKESFV